MNKALAKSGINGDISDSITDGGTKGSCLNKKQRINKKRGMGKLMWKEINVARKYLKIASNTISFPSSLKSCIRVGNVDKKNFCL